MVRYKGKVEVEKIRRHLKEQIKRDKSCYGILALMLSISTIFQGMLYSAVTECENLPSIPPDLEIF